MPSVDGNRGAVCSVERVFVGRDGIRSRIEAMLAAARAGDGAALALCGEPGAGKTALLGFAAEAGADLQLLRVRGVENESSLGYAALADLLAPILDRVAALPEPQAAALKAALRLGPPVAADRFAVCAATVGLVAEAARTRPVLVVVDDAHWLDGASTEALLFLARRLAVTAACALFAYRDAPGVPEPPDLLPRLVVPGLDAGDATRVLDAAGVRTDAETVRWFMRETGGNPLALTDLPKLLSAQDIDARSRTTRPAPLPAALEQVYGRLIRRLAGPTRRALLVAALLDGRGAALLHSVLADAGLAANDLLPALDAGLLVQAGGDIAFRHPLVRSAVLQTAGARARRDTHLLVAAGLAGATDPELVDARAWHLADAAAGRDDETARLLADTARAALERGGLHAAALAYERSAELTTDPALQRARLVEAAKAEFAAGLTSRCVALLERLGPDPSPDVLQLRGRVEMWTGAPLAGGERLVDVADHVLPTDPMRAFTLLMDAMSGIAMSGRLARAQEVGERLRDIGERVGPPVTQVAEATAATIMALRGMGQNEEARLDRALSALPVDDPGPLLEIFIFFGAGYLFLDRLDTARDMFSSYVRLCREAGALSGLSFALSALSVTEFRSGRWDGALGAALESVRLAEDTDRRTDLPNCLVTLALVEAARGKDAARDHAELAVEQAARIDLRVVEAQGRSMLGLLDLGLGNLDAAVEQLERCGAAARATGTGQVCNLQWAPELVEALVRSGRRAATRPTIDYLDERAGALGTPFVVASAARCRGMVAAGRGYDTEFRTALEQHRRGASRPFETARTQLAYGERLRRDRRRKDSRVHLRAAWKTFTLLGAEPWTRRAAAELQAAGVEVSSAVPDALAVLTAQERLVATAVAGGSSNREVAGRLFLSEKTVEFHLSNVYRKLQVRSRGELRARL